MLAPSISVPARMTRGTLRAKNMAISPPKAAAAAPCATRSFPCRSITRPKATLTRLAAMSTVPRMRA